MKKYQKRAYRPEDYNRVNMAEAGRLAEESLSLPEIASSWASASASATHIPILKQSSPRNRK